MPYEPFGGQYSPDKAGREHSCIKGDTILLGENKAISDVAEGGYVRGLTGDVKIAEKMVRQYSGNMIRLSVSGILPFEVTPDHPLLVRRSKLPHEGGLAFREPKWVPASEVFPKLSF